MTYATKTLRQQYRVRAHGIGSNAIALVNEFFDLYGGIEDRVEYPLGGTWVKCKYYQWTLTDLDRALDAMYEAKLKRQSSGVVGFYKGA